MRTKEILVGTDGTTTSRAAVRWAAREAHRRRRPLRIAHAFDWRSEAARYDVGAENVDVARLLADAVVAAALDEARMAAPTVAVEADTLIGDPARRLLSAAADEGDCPTMSNNPDAPNRLASPRDAGLRSASTM